MPGSALGHWDVVVSKTKDLLSWSLISNGDDRQNIKRLIFSKMSNSNECYE